MYEKLFNLISHDGNAEKKTQGDVILHMGDQHK